MKNEDLRLVYLLKSLRAVFTVEKTVFMWRQHTHCHVLYLVPGIRYLYATGIRYLYSNTSYANYSRPVFLVSSGPLLAFYTSFSAGGGQSRGETAVSSY